jgi:hypothetical protein
LNAARRPHVGQGAAPASCANARNSGADRDAAILGRSAEREEIRAI